MFARVHKSAAGLLGFAYLVFCLIALSEDRDVE
jgi:hypothetical protein